MRPTDSFTEHQHAALEWFESWIPSFGGPTTYDLTAEIKNLAGATRGLSVEEVKARRERLELELMRRIYKNTKNISGVALTLHLLQKSRLVQPFKWTMTGQFGNIRTADDVLYCRQMCCYEFVHMCGWIAGAQTVGAGGISKGVPLMQSSGSSIVKGGTGSFRTTAPENRLPPNTIIFGKAWAFNNNDDYYHVGIVDKVAKIYHLGSNSNGIGWNTRSQVFGASYREIYSGSYRFR